LLKMTKIFILICTILISSIYSEAFAGLSWRADPIDLSLQIGVPKRDRYWVGIDFLGFSVGSKNLFIGSKLVSANRNAKDWGKEEFSLDAAPVTVHYILGKLSDDFENLLTYCYLNSNLWLNFSYLKKMNSDSSMSLKSYYCDVGIAFDGFDSDGSALVGSKLGVRIPYISAPENTIETKWPITFYFKIWIGWSYLSWDNQKSR
jgi:hypothetical protein